MTLASPVSAYRHTLRFTPSRTSECHSCGNTPKRSANRAFQPADKAISGNRISTCLPASSTRWTASKYTSVFPDPVTPSSRNGTNPLPSAAAMLVVAAIWSADRAGPCRRPGRGGGLSLSTSNASRLPARSMPEITPALTPDSRCSSGDVRAPAVARTSATRRRAVVSFSPSGGGSDRRNSFCCGGGNSAFG